MKNLKHRVQKVGLFNRQAHLRKRLITLCLLSPVLILNVCFGMDFGDAPDPFYPTTLSNDGARHTATGPTLGILRDSETDGLPDANALGDDLDGDWLDAGEQIASSSAMAIGNNVININIPCGATAGITYTRFRLSSTGGLSPSGHANDGEIEDHEVTLLPATPMIACPQDLVLNFEDSAEPYRAPESPIIHYDFNNSSFEVQDISASTTVHNGFQLGAVGFQNGIESMAADLSTEGCVEVQNHPEINGAPVGDRSISFWFIVDTSAPPARIVVYEEGNANTGLSIYVNQLSQELNVGIWKGQGIAPGFTGIPGVDYSLLQSGIGTIINNNWYHVTLVLNSAGGTVQAFLDGASMDNDTFGFPLPTHNGGVCVGGVHDDTRYLDSGEVTDGDGDYLNGRMDQFLLYNRVLTTEEVSGLADINRSQNSAGGPLAIGSCSTNLEIGRNDIVSAGTSGIVWTIDRTWSAQNQGGNSASCIQVIDGFDPFIFGNGFEPINNF